MRFKLLRLALIGIAAIVCRYTMGDGLVHAAESVAQIALLKQHSVDTDTPSILAYLRRLQPNDKLQVEIATLIGQLSDADFAVREAAFAKLPTFGDAARTQLDAATKSDDPETAWRSGKILAQLNSAEEANQRNSLILASLQLLQSRRDPQATAVILTTIPLLTESHLYDAACQSLWACVDRVHTEELKQAIGSSDVRVRAAALVALEVAAGEDASSDIAPLLKNKEALLRLAAARALVDRQPADVVKVLIELAAEEDQDIAWQADALLQLKTGKQLPIDNQLSLGESWKLWAGDHLATAKLDTVVGEKRLDLSAGRNTLDVMFTRDQPSLAKGYGPFQYESDNGGTAKVVDGKLRISGDNPEGDQRLYITSQRMIGRDRWPDSVEVTTRITAAAGGDFGRHVGVSVGRVKVLFHPGLSGGAFRAETTDDHDYLFNNETMPCDASADAMHEMTIRVRKTDQGADFDVSFHGAKGGAPYTKKFSVTPKQLGDFNRIGLERSGRTGGDALFDSVSIRLGQ